jgi:bifunctional non-homologous end joining protein LigD
VQRGPLRRREAPTAKRTRVGFARLDKLLIAGAGDEPPIDKRELIDYYRRIAPVVRRHLADRPIALQRFPDGIDAEGFYQKQVPEFYPDWIDTVEVATADGRQRLVCGANGAVLAYLANQACITLHAWLARRAHLNRPDQMIFDLDPPSADAFAAVKDAALELKALLHSLGLPSWVKTTGSKGLHVMVVLDGRAGFDTVRAFARRIAERLVARAPHAYTVEQRIAARGDRVYIDVMRNAYAQTAVTPYAVRARRGAPVATPLEWRELDDASLTAQRFTMRNLFERLAQRGDPWHDAFKRRFSVERASERLGGE